MRDSAGIPSQPLLQPPDHLEGQRALAIEHLMHAIAAADEGNQIARLKPALLHLISDRLNRIGKVERTNVCVPRLPRK
jgi:hypothetical protein